MKLRYILFSICIFCIGRSFGQITENFDGTVTGWSFSGALPTTGQVCSGTKSILYNATAQSAISPSITNPSKLDCNIKRSGTATVWSVEIQISDASPISQTSGPWTTVTTIGSTVSTSCSPITQVDLSSYSGLRYVKFLDTRLTGSSQRGIDDVNITTIATSAPVITSPLTAVGTENTLFSNYTIVATNSPTSYSATGLPLGLSINTSTGVVSGTPTVFGTFNVSITATNGIGNDIKTLVITISAGSPKINIRGVIGLNPTIFDGDVTPSGLNNTLFAAQTIGNSQTKNFRIENTGTSSLTVSAITFVGGNPSDFILSGIALPLSIPSGGSPVDFTITFAPTAAGIRNTTVTIANNDLTLNANPYDFLIQGTGNCAVSTNTITPASGPEGTEVTITATANNLNGATVTFNGVAAIVTQISSTIIKVIVPVGATTGSLVTTNAQGCTASNSFVIIQKDVTSCQGSASTFTDLIISEVYDSNGLNVWHMELFNPTASAINLGSSVYKIERYATIGDATPSRTVTLTGMVAAGAVFVAELGDSGVSCTYPFNFTSPGAGINAMDEIRLTKNNVPVDVVYCPNEVGYSIQRVSTATGPTTTFNGLDWNTISNEICSDIGTFTSSGTLPIVTLQPSFVASCATTSTVLTVSGTEGFVGGNPLAYQWYFVAPNATNWTVVPNTVPYSGATLASLTITSLTGLNGYQYYCQVRENTATCFKASNAVKVLESNSTTWNGLAPWTNGIPTLSSSAIINGNYNTSTNGNFEACSLIITNLGNLNITSTGLVTIENNLNINTGGIVTVDNNGSLIQNNDASTNLINGTFTLNRTANVRKFDYVYWSNPVDELSKNVTSVSPGTLSTHIWNWTPTVSGNFGNWFNTTENMIAGKGYCIRGDNTFNNTTATNLTALFSGKPNNGIVLRDIVRGSYQGANYLNGNGITVTKEDDNWNLVGNPYPSAIDAISFLQENSSKIEGAVRIWTHGSLPNATNLDPFYNNYVLNYSANDYIVYNLAGASVGPSIYNGFIPSGQGFFVLMNDGTADATQKITFNNAMRKKNVATTTLYSNTQFFKLSTIENTSKNGIWLDLISQTGVAARTLVGYYDGATINKDSMFDAYKNESANQAIYSLIENEKMIIQGRPTPFLNTDFIPLGVTIPVSNTNNYSISIGATNGLFLNENQNVFIEDKKLNLIHNLRLSPYSFASEEGVFNSRFVLRFNNSTLNSYAETFDSEVLITTNNNQIKVTSGTETIENIVVYDVLGRVLKSNSNIKSNEVILSDFKLNQTLIVKVTLNNGNHFSRKVVL